MSNYKVTFKYAGEIMSDIVTAADESGARERVLLSFTATDRVNVKVIRVKLYE